MKDRDFAKLRASLYGDDLARMFTLLLANQTRYFNERVLRRLGYRVQQAPRVETLLEEAEKNGFIKRRRGWKADRDTRVMYCSPALYNRQERGYLPLKEVEPEAEVTRALERFRAEGPLFESALRWLGQRSWIIFTPGPETALDPPGFPLHDKDNVKRFLEAAAELACLTPAWENIRTSSITFQVLEERCREVAEALRDPCFIPRGIWLDKTVAADVFYQSKNGASYLTHSRCDIVTVHRMCAQTYCRWLNGLAAEEDEFRADLGDDVPPEDDSPSSSEASEADRLRRFFLREMVEVGVLHLVRHGHTNSVLAVNRPYLDNLLAAIAEPDLIPTVLEEASNYVQRIRQGGRRKAAEAAPVAEPADEATQLTFWLQRRLVRLQDACREAEGVFADRWELMNVLGYATEGSVSALLRQAAAEGILTYENMRAGKRLWTIRFRRNVRQMWPDVAAAVGPPPTPAAEQTAPAAKAAGELKKYQGRLTRLYDRCGGAIWKTGSFKSLEELAAFLDLDVDGIECRRMLELARDKYFLLLFTDPGWRGGDWIVQFLQDPRQLCPHIAQEGGSGQPDKGRKEE